MLMIVIFEKFRIFRFKRFVAFSCDTLSESVFEPQSHGVTENAQRLFFKYEFTESTEWVYWFQRAQRIWRHGVDCSPFCGQVVKQHALRGVIDGKDGAKEVFEGVQASGVAGA